MITSYNPSLGFCRLLLSLHHLMWASPLLPISKASVIIQDIIPTCPGFCSWHLLEAQPAHVAILMISFLWLHITLCKLCKTLAGPQRLLAWSASDSALTPPPAPSPWLSPLRVQRLPRPLTQPFLCLHSPSSGLLMAGFFMEFWSGHLLREGFHVTPLTAFP